MNQYNFNILTSEEFEELTKDLLSAELNLDFRSFANGPDGGIDLRFSSANEDSGIVVQCKRYKSAASLMAELKKERKKLDAMNPVPVRYILSLSIDLSPPKIDELAELFKPYIHSTNDIFTPKHLNSMLHRHEAVERRHYKLWISSSNVLKTIMASSVANYTGLIEEKIKKTLEVYSHTPSFDEAMDALRDHGFIVIAGEPGVGKTTLAEVMSYYLLGDKSFNELVALPGDINDALRVMSSDPSAKQLFLFDDFLGTNYLDYKISRKEDGVFRALIENIGHLKKNKALIMTTREYILSQAQQSVVIFKDDDFMSGKYVIDLSKYSKEVKAKILCNHLSLSNMPEEHLEYFVRNKIYRDIINHPNYSPRLIEAINKQRLWEGCTPESFGEKIIDLFNNPWMLYEDIYENKITEYERDIMLVMMSIGRSVSMDALYHAVSSFNQSITEIQFQKSIDILEGTFLKTATDESDRIIVSVLNPTIYDFVTHYHRKHSSYIQKLIKSTVYLNQLTHPFTLTEDNDAYMARVSYSKYKPILIDEYGQKAFKDKIMNEWRVLAWIGDSSVPTRFDAFDILTKLFKVMPGMDDAKQVMARELLDELEDSEVYSSNFQAALDMLTAYFDDEKISEAMAINFVDSVGDSFVSYDDLTALVELDGSTGMIKQIIDMLADKIASDDYCIEILNEEVRERLLNHEDISDVKSEMGDVLDYIGINRYFVDEVYDRHSEPPEDYDSSRFYSKGNEDYKGDMDIQRNSDSAIDNIFKSLI